MKITVFTSNQPRHVSLINALTRAGEEVFAIQECGTIFPGQVEDFFRKSPVMQDYFSRVISAEREVFGQPTFTAKNVRTISIKMGDLSKLDVETFSPAMNSDVFVVFGSSYIKGELCEQLVDRRAINIHMGISPQYRGSSTNFWAMYDRRPEFVGATIHRLSAGLDSGPILFHALPKPAAVDPFVFGMRAVKAAHDALIDQIKSSRIFDFAPVQQDRSRELRYTKNADFTDEVAREYLSRLPKPAEMAAVVHSPGDFVDPIVKETDMTRPRVAILFIILIGAAVRFPGIFTDFWLDEIWSYDIARGVEPAHIDNNHLLNTWLIKAIGTSVREWWIFRIPPLIFGVGTIALAAHAMRRRGTPAMIFAAILLALSFPFVFYSSEARGYSMAAFFAVLALDALLTHFEQPRWSSAILFNLACILGFLSHLTFVHFYFAAVIWSAVLALRSKKPIQFWLRLNLPVIVFGLALHHFFVRDIAIGGAAHRDPLGVLIETLSVPLGGPPVGAMAIITAACAVAILFCAILILAMQREVIWIFYLLAIVIAPAFFLAYDLQISQRPQPLMLRYFLVALAMLLLVGAELASALWKHPPGRVVVVTLLAVFAIANTVKTIDFYHFGRGGYSRAVAHMFDVSPDQVVTVDADNEFSSGRIVDFYAPRLAPPGRSIDFRHTRAAATQASHPPEWVIISDPARVARKAEVSTSPSNEIYRLDSQYPCTSLSGTSWLLYRIDISATLRMQRASTQPAEQK